MFHFGGRVGDTAIRFSPDLEGLGNGLPAEMTFASEMLQIRIVTVWSFWDFLRYLTILGMYRDLRASLEAVRM
jgi:hypothetical protein